MVDHADASKPILSVRGLAKRYPLSPSLFGRRQWRDVVQNVSFDIPRGTTLGLVGESGCGKSTLARMILRLVPPTAGTVHFDGIDLFALSRAQLRPLRRRMQIIFQDPVGSLNPRLKVGTIVGEPMLVHRLANRRTMRRKVATLLEQCGLPPDAAERYPHEFSGGQRQRVGIARALSVEPDLIVCDEPTSALDVSVQAQILNLLRELQQQRNLSYLFISHDLAVVRHMADTIAVMQHGRIVERGPAAQVIDQPQHDYTKQLLDAVPTVDVAARTTKGVLA